MLELQVTGPQSDLLCPEPYVYLSLIKLNLRFWHALTSKGKTCIAGKTVRRKKAIICLFVECQTSDTPLCEYLYKMKDLFSL